MFHLIKWELSHIFRQKSLYILLFLILLLQISSLWNAEQLSEEFQEKASQLKGTISEQELSRATNGTESSGFSPENSIYENFAYAGIIQSSQDERLLTIEEKLSARQGKTAALELEKDMREEVDVMYWNQHDVPQNIIDFLAVEGFIFLAGFLLLGLHAMVSRDDAHHVSAYVLSSKYGRNKLATAKLWSAVIYATLILWLIVLMGWVTEYTRLSYWDKGLEGWEVPFQYFFKFINSPYSYTFLEYHVVQVMLMWGASLALSVMFVLLSSVVRSSFVSFIAGGFLFGLPLLFAEMLFNEYGPNGYPGWLDAIYPFTLPYLLKVDALFQSFRVYEIGSFALTGLGLAVIILVSCFVLFAGLYKLVMARRHAEV
ncbi:hypothetical protein [Thalassobacillus hwangdonensis]|uniref:ABC-2 type transport system permease protein n=1 Tax=Thalassobacillus hwangdonensis TaxID=546108 RepID=A0ABW3L2D0_9BACI